MKKVPCSKPLDTKQAGAFLGKPSGTLVNWRVRRFGPVFYRVGGSIRYFEEDLLAFLQAHRVEPGQKARRVRRGKP